MSSVARLLAGLALLVSTTAGVLVLSAGPAAACSCVAMPDSSLLESSDVAFSGVVVKRREVGDEAITTVRTDLVFKGDVTQRVDVVANKQSSACALAADDGDRLLVFGDLAEGEVSSSLCTSATGRNYRKVLAELREGAAPSAGYMKAERRGLGLSHDQFAAGRAILGVLGLTALAFFAFRTWRARRRTPR